jgi:hypothetical protein
MKIFVKGKEIGDWNGSRTMSRDPNAQVIIFEHHNHLLTYFNETGTPNKLPTWVLSHNEFKADAPMGIFLHNPPDSGNRLAALKTALGLVESGLATICVVDERLYKSCADGSLFRPLTRANVVLPKINYDKPKLADMAKVVSAVGQFGFLVIHQGILDKVFDSNQRKIEKWITKEVSPKTPLTVVISGRGVPHNLPSNSRSLPLSAIDKWVLGSQSKFHFVQTLIGSRSRR